MTESEQKAQKWDYARVCEKHAIEDLTLINQASGQIAHSQADGIMVAFCRKAGFKDIADKFENTSEERGFTYTERT